MALNIPLRVKNLVQRCGTSNPYQIAREMNCDVEFLPLPHHINGLWRRVLRRKFIVINESLEEWQKEAVLCHEIAHILCHSHYRAFSMHGQSYSCARYEREADEFAAHLMAYRHDNNEIYVKQFLSESWHNWR